MKALAWHGKGDMRCDEVLYNATKAFLDSFSYALREELKDTGVTVTCLMPGATETQFFRRVDMLDTKVGTDKKDDPADVAKDGFKAMMSGEGGVASGWQNKLEAAAAHVIPSERLAKKHSKWLHRARRRSSVRSRFEEPRA